MATGRRVYVYVLTCLFTLALPACHEVTEYGYVLLNAPNDGTFEIYRYIDGPDSIERQFVSEEVGYFNEPVALAPGNYLVLSDCSSESVVVRPQQTVSLTVHRIEFKPPRAPGPGDSFSIQCHRANVTQSRQNFVGRYGLNLLSGRREILVGMVPMTIELQDEASQQRPQVRSFDLAAIQVGEVDGDESHSFFVSPRDELVSITRPQTFGNWEFLLPGPYRVEINGTKTDIDLKPTEERVIVPAFVRVSASENVDLTAPSRIKGRPQLIEINAGHWLEFNTAYPIVPGPASLKLSGSSRRIEIETLAGETFELEAASVTVSLACSPWEYTCLGSREIALYLADQPYPFAESVSDIPVMFFQNENDIYVGVEGSRDIRYRLPQKVRDKALHVGFVRLRPTPVRSVGRVTDLVRVEAIQTPYVGHTLDIDLAGETVMPLIAGWYQLAQFFSSTTAEGERDKSVRAFRVHGGRSVTVDFQVYFSEEKLLAVEKKQQQRKRSARARTFRFF